MVILDLVQSPRAPPPLRGVYATFAIEGDTPRQIEMSWGTGSTWTLRSGDDRTIDSQLARAFLRGGQITFSGGNHSMPAEVLSWNFTGFGEALEHVRSECSG